jgi:hypothetical protein
MNVRKGYSDSRLNKIMKSSEDNENLNNFLPRFLVKDICDKDDSAESDDMICVQTTEEDSMTAGHQTGMYSSGMPMKEREQFRPIKSRFNSSGDVRQFAKEYKNQLFTQFQNTISRNIPSGFSGNKPQPHSGRTETGASGSSTFNNFGKVKFDQYNFGIFQPYSSANDSNLSILEDFNNLNFAPIRPQPKRVNSSGNLDFKSSSTKSGMKSKSSLFITDKGDDRCEDFEDIQHLLDTITCELWVYARTQKGSRNLQKLLNKIQPDDLDIILEKIKNNFYDLMTDIYGNYFCQKLIHCCSAEQRMFILKHVSKCLILRY